MSAAARTTARWAIALLIAFTTEATAAGLNLAWDDCGAGGQCNKDFACNTNTGAPFSLVASFVPPEGTTKITGEEISIEICSNGGYMPPWWSYRNAGSCRTSAMQASIDAASASLTRCEDYWSFAGAGGIASYDPMYRGGGDRAIIRLVFAVPTTVAGPVDATREYYACIVRFTRDKTVGTGSCAGCSTPMGLRLQEVRLTQPVGLGDYRLTTPVTLTPDYDSSIATWQHGSFRHWNAPQFWACPAAVPVRNSTWGAIKAQYR